MVLLLFWQHEPQRASLRQEPGRLHRRPRPRVGDRSAGGGRGVGPGSGFSADFWRLSCTAERIIIVVTSVTSVVISKITLIIIIIITSAKDSSVYGRRQCACERCFYVILQV